MAHVALLERPSIDSISLTMAAWIVVGGWHVAVVNQPAQANSWIMSISCHKIWAWVPRSLGDKVDAVHWCCGPDKSMWLILCDYVFNCFYIGTWHVSKFWGFWGFWAVWVLSTHTTFGLVVLGHHANKCSSCISFWVFIHENVLAQHKKTQGISLGQGAPPVVEENFISGVYTGLIQSCVALVWFVRSFSLPLYN